MKYTLLLMVLATTALSLRSCQEDMHVPGPRPSQTPPKDTPPELEREGLPPL